MNIFNLDRTFIHRTPTHEFQIKWTRLGDTTRSILVFVHGTPWSSVEWQNLAEALCHHFDIYVYDHPGFGSSPSPRRLVDTQDNEKIDLDGSLNLRAEASAALFKHWDLDELPHVVAHDNGGLVSLRLLLQYELPFASLCLMDVVVLGPFGLPFFKLVAENWEVFKAIPPQLTEGFVRAYVRNAMHKPMPKEIEDILCAPWLPGGTQGPVRFLEEMVQAHNRDNTPLSKEFSRVGELVPLKIIWGKEDSWLPVEIASRLKSALNARELVIVEDAGHLVHYDQPARIALEVRLWDTLP